MGESLEDMTCVATIAMLYVYGKAVKESPFTKSTKDLCKIKCCTMLLGCLLPPFWQLIYF